MFRFTESRSNSISCTPIISQKELERLTCLNRSSSPLSRFAKKPEQLVATADAVQRYRFTRCTMGNSRTAPSSPETHKEEESAVAEIAVAESDETPAPNVQSPPSTPPPTVPSKSVPVLVHVADYVSSDCVDSVDSDDQQSLLALISSAPVMTLDHHQPFPESSDDELPGGVDNATSSGCSGGGGAGGVQVTASKSDGHIYKRQCQEFDASTSSLNRQTQCCMSFKPHPKSSRKKSQSHSCHVV